MVKICNKKQTIVEEIIGDVTRSDMLVDVCDKAIFGALPTGEWFSCWLGHDIILSQVLLKRVANVAQDML